MPAVRMLMLCSAGGLGNSLASTEIRLKMESMV